MSRITQRGATGALSLTANGTFQTSTDANNLTYIGTRWDLSDGREVILVSTGTSTTTTAGQLYQDAAVVPNHQGLAVTAVQAYSNNGNTPATVTVTLGATAMTTNQYQGGFALVTANTGAGQTLRIASHPAAASSATGVVITLEDGPVVALDTTSTINLMPPHGAGVIQNPTTPTGALAGVALYQIAASSTAATPTCGFLLTKGVTAVLADASAPAVGLQVVPSTVTAGAIMQGGGTGAVVGYTAQTSTSAQNKLVFVNL